MVARMKQRIFIGSIWFWGFWSLGSTLEFLGVFPSWPLLAVGALTALAAAGIISLPSARRRGHGARVHGARPESNRA